MKDSQNQKTKKRFFKKTKPKPALSQSKPQIKDNQNKNSAALSNNLNTFLKNHEYTFILILVPLILLFIFGIIFLLTSKHAARAGVLKHEVTYKQKNISLPINNSVYIPFVTARAALVMDADSKSVIFAKNQDLRFSMASTAKIMTALVALDYYKSDSVLVIKSGRIGGSVVGLERGDRYYFDDLLYAMLLPSANDAAVAIVDNYPGGKTNFIKRMNEKATEMHLSNTSFSDPAGLDDDGNFTTAKDLAILGTFAMENTRLSKIVGTYQKTISNFSKSKKFSLFNLNRLLGTYGVNGIKTGTTEGAGEVLLTSFQKKGRDIIIVVMNSQDRFSDTTTLLNYTFANVDFVELVTPGEK